MPPRVTLGHGSYSASVTEDSQVAPSTPKKRSVPGGFDLWFFQFSNLYNLNLRRPDPTLTRQERKALPYYTELKFYDRLSYHYHQGNSDEIRRLFDRGARSIHSRWVKKPHGDADVTPSASYLPRATTEPERRQLLELLETILDGLSPVKPLYPYLGDHKSLSPRRTAHTFDDPPSPSVRHQPKRQSDEWEATSPSPKRSRSITDDSRPTSALSVLDRGGVRSNTPLSRPGPSHLAGGLYQLPVSVNTSRSTVLSEVFSEKGEDEPLPGTQETQITVEASTQEKKSLLARISDSDSLAPSSGTERALLDSFEKHQDALQQNVRDLLVRNSSPVYAYSEFSAPPEPGTGTLDGPEVLESHASPKVRRLEKLDNVPAIETRLEEVWPRLPTHFDGAPLAIRWEILRVALHCGVEMHNLRLDYDSALRDQSLLWTRLRSLPVFHGKILPERSRPEAWKAGLNHDFRSVDQVVILSASLTLNSSKERPLFYLTLHPLKLDLPHRLDRRFGSDRFLEFTMPSISSSDMKKLGDPVLESIHRWVARSSHVLLGRLWKAFSVKPALAKKVSRDDTLLPESKIIPQERVYLFAEDGNDFHRPATKSPWPLKGEASDAHTSMARGSLIDWLLQVPNNQKQPLLKLFSRITLGLSRTYPTIVLSPEQIRHSEKDLLSPTGKVMNDGIARMSIGLARRIRDTLGLAHMPAGYQGRFGSAKGFWIRDTTDTADEIWIETMPSQRKWVCDYDEEDHRTFEVRSEVRELKSANLNLQLLPILEDRALDASRMKEEVGNFMRHSLLQEIESQKAAMQDAHQFRLWTYENSRSSRLQGRVRLGHIPWLAGLPISREDQMDHLLSAGFDPTRLEFLRNIAWSLRKEKCEELQTRLNVKVGLSTYAFMVVDFLGVLEEGEVHLGFSSKFSDEQSGFSETFLHGLDVLVARTPAHYPSDIQKVKAVFKPELGSLKDVIVFSTKGDTPLAEMLSGGDYDGDIAWVCWEPKIVDNFGNADVLPTPDLFRQGTLSKNKSTYRDLVRSQGTEDVTVAFFDQAFRFNMQSNLLGTCTNYKEKLCYSRNSVCDEPAIFLSTLISHLVDRAKQGIIFTDEDWIHLKRELNGQQGDRKRASKKLEPPLPQYKNNDWDGRSQPTHITDFVKFSVGKPTVDNALKELNNFLNKAELFDEDLVRYVKHYEKLQRPLAERKQAERDGSFKKSTWEKIFEELKKDIDAVATKWRDFRGDWDEKLVEIHGRWQEIVPTEKANNSKTARILVEEGQASVGLSSWDLLKASFLFKMYYRKLPGLPWYIAGYQLAFLKALYTGQNTTAPPVLMTASMYGGSRPDARFVRAMAVVNEGRRLEDAREEGDGDEATRGDGIPEGDDT